MSTNWKEQAINDLCKHKANRVMIENLKDKIKLIELKMKSVSSPVAGTLPKKSNMPKDEILDLVVQKDETELLLALYEYNYNMVERGLAELREYQKTVLTYFYIDKEYNHIDKLKTLLGYERAQIYKIKDKALNEFANYCYCYDWRQVGDK